ncbi:MAG: ribonuclease D [Luteolibacter sp.]|jgi:ribonuclease D
MIDTTEKLAEFLGSSRPEYGPPICAIDTEADSLHRYRESLCLVQFATRDECLLIDPIAIDDLSPLGDYLAPATVWMHGADYDMTMLKRELGVIPAVVPDTQIGARLLGLRRFGLADLVLHYFDIELSKSSQKADWGKRPLSDKMVEYALNDVRYLLEMGDIITNKLRDYDRLHWFEESCNAARDKVMERDESREEMWRVKGSGKLDPRGLAWLRALWHWRDKEAEAWDKPSFMVVPNRELLEWATTLAAGGKAPLPRHYRSDRVKRFQKMIDDFRSMPESEWPMRPEKIRRKRDKSFDRITEGFLKARDAKAAELDIDPSLIAARAVLEAIACGETTAEESLLNWQRECLGI